MKYLFYFFTLTTILLSVYLFCNSAWIKSPSAQIKGITMVAPPAPFPSDPMPLIKNTNANWVAIIPFAFSKKGNPEVHYDSLGWQWWGEKPDGIRESIRLAKNAGLQVMLKPQVWMHDDWVGAMDFNSEEEWKQWEHAYRMYILQQLRLARQCQVELFCIATEYNIAAIKRESFFRQLIAEMRNMYSGKLCYCATWNTYREVAFWDALDYIGISAYFPLSDEITPDSATLNKAWHNYLPEMEQYSKKINKKILFAEFGYLSVDGCAGKSWELESKIATLPVNQKAQANAYESLFNSLYDKPWWAGGFVWKWFPNGEGHEGYPEKDYTPQGKLAEEVLKKWYSK